jgi:predicted metal-dependent hydrolase
VSRKSDKIAAQIASFRGRRQDAHYLAYFECFNTGLYYEAHDVLEELWLRDKTGRTGNFYKGLIQLAGAFVHMQKHTDARPRLKPAAALFRLAQKNLSAYPAQFEGLDVGGVLDLIEGWLSELEAGEFETNPLTEASAPRLHLGEK